MQYAGVAKNEVQKQEERLKGACRQICTLRRRYERWCEGDDIEDCTHKERYKASYPSMVKILQQNTGINIEQIELQAKLLNHFLGSNKSNINQSENS